ncbi:hypothetical protein VPHF86_0294 [Vibrio phage F86]
MNLFVNFLLNQPLFVNVVCIQKCFVHTSPILKCGGDSEVRTQYQRRMKPRLYHHKLSHQRRYFSFNLHTG